MNHHLTNHESSLMTLLIKTPQRRRFLGTPFSITRSAKELKMEFRLIGNFFGPFLLDGNLKFGAESRGILEKRRQSKKCKILNIFFGVKSAILPRSLSYIFRFFLCLKLF